MKKLFLKITVCLVAVCGFHSAASAQLFFVEDFDYADGDLAVVSAGLWQQYSGGTPDIQVLDGSAVVTAPGSQDNARDIGALIGNEEVWYYALRFSVQPSQDPKTMEDLPINNGWFACFRPSDDPNFRFSGRIATTDPTGDADFSLQVWPSSFGDGRADWDGDFAYGEEITAVVCWDNATATASMWVNPTSMASTSVSLQSSDVEDPNAPLDTFALRQDGFPAAGAIVTIPILAVGDDFDAVLAAVSDTKTKCDFPLGDVNQDGSVALSDIPGFVELLSSGGNQCEADIDGSGSVTLADIPLFVELLAGG